MSTTPIATAVAARHVACNGLGMVMLDTWMEPDLPDDESPAPELPDPRSVLRDATLTRQQKIDTLRRWSYDARELDVANEEGMGGEPRPSNLAAILAALHELGASDVPTSHKQ
jgi:hypothetical protein